MTWYVSHVLMLTLHCCGKLPGASSLSYYYANNYSYLFVVINNAEIAQFVDISVDIFAQNTQSYVSERNKHVKLSRTSTVYALGYTRQRGARD